MLRFLNELVLRHQIELECSASSVKHPLFRYSLKDSRIKFRERVAEDQWLKGSKFVIRTF